MILRYLQKKWVVLVLITSLGSCAPALTSVNNFSKTASAGIQKYEDIGYSFSQHCIDRCRLESLKDFTIKRVMECQCDLYKKADSVTLLLYSAVKGYFNGLAQLSGNEIIDYSFDALKKSLTEGTFGEVEINSEHVNAYSNISKILLRATTDAYRKNKIKIYIAEANAPLKVLLDKLRFILRENLAGELNFKKERLYIHYRELNMNPSLSDYEKEKAVTDYYRQLSEIVTKQK